MHRWERALEIAEKHNIDINMVLEERRKYLNAINREETSVSFLKKKNELK
jgi:intraflagellar transport protein 80